MAKIALKGKGKASPTASREYAICEEDGTVVGSLTLPGTVKGETQSRGVPYFVGNLSLEHNGHRVGNRNVVAYQES